MEFARKGLRDCCQQILVLSYEKSWLLYTWIYSTFTFYTHNVIFVTHTPASWTSNPIISDGRQSSVQRCDVCDVSVESSQHALLWSREALPAFAQLLISDHLKVTKRQTQIQRIPKQRDSQVMRLIKMTRHSCSDTRQLLQLLRCFIFVLLNMPNARGIALHILEGL